MKVKINPKRLVKLYNDDFWNPVKKFKKCIDNGELNRKLFAWEKFILLNYKAYCFQKNKI
jgi:hypothetical protein